MRSLHSFVPALSILLATAPVAAGPAPRGEFGFTLIRRGGDIVPNPASVVTDQLAAEGVIFGRPGVSAGVALVLESAFAPSSGLDSFVGLDADGVIPGHGEAGAAVGDIHFRFVHPRTGEPATARLVTFTIGDAGRDEDVFEVRSYGIDGELLERRSVSGTERFTVTLTKSGVHRVEVDFLGDCGYSFDDLEFELDGPDEIAWAAPPPRDQLL